MIARLQRRALLILSSFCVLLLPTYCFAGLYILTSNAQKCTLFIALFVMPGVCLEPVMSSACGSLNLRPWAFYICFARNACGLAGLRPLAIYICLRQAPRLRARARCQAKKMGSAQKNGGRSPRLVSRFQNLQIAWRILRILLSIQH